MADLVGPLGDIVKASGLAQRKGFRKPICFLPVLSLASLRREVVLYMCRSLWWSLVSLSPECHACINNPVYYYYYSAGAYLASQLD